MVLREHLDPLELKVCLVCLEEKEALVSLVLEVLRVSPVVLVCLVLMVYLEQMVRMEDLVSLVLLAEMVCLVSPERKDPWGSRDSLVWMDRRARVVYLDFQELMERRVLPVLEEHLVPKVEEVPRESLVCPVCLDRRENLVELHWMV